jgi:acyl-CoA synthetase (AMP-forming)/AMP-acid ligase II
LVDVLPLPISPERALFGDLPFDNGAADDALALVLPESSMTMGMLREASTRYARSLLALGVRPGDRVAVYGFPSPELVGAIFGLAMVGAAIVPANSRYQAYELRYILEHAGVCGIVTVSGADRNLLQTVEQVRPEQAWILDLSRQQVTGSVAGTADNLAQQRSAQDAHDRRAGARREDLVLICYTSGTTARPKGVMLDHDVVRGYLNVARRLGIRPGDVCYSPTPMFHIAGLGALFMAIANAATLLTCPFFHAGAAVRQLREHPPTVMLTLFPPISLALLQHEDFDPSILEEVRVAVQVGASEVQHRLERTLPAGSVVSTYGLTESGSGLTTIGAPSDPVDVRLSSCGRPLPGLEVRIVDPFTREICAPNEPGEIQLRAWGAPGKPYYANPDASAAQRTKDGWFMTGDRGLLTADGSLVFQDRLKDMLRVGGENVSPAEIEALLMEHDAVAIAQVVGGPDERLEEVPVAFVELEPGATATADELLGYCKAHLARFKHPREIRIVDTWPMSATKIQKNKLRELVVTPQAA